MTSGTGSRRQEEGGGREEGGMEEGGEEVGEGRGERGME